MKHLFLIIIIIIQYYSQAQNQIVYGKVIDERGDNIPGVTVSLENTTICTMTLSDGSYRILMPLYEPWVLKFSHIGMIEQKVTISYTTNLPLMIMMKDSGLKTDAEIQSYYYSNSKIRSLLFLFNTEKYNADFNEFRELNQKDRILFNDVRYGVGIGIGGYYDNFYGSFVFGVGSNSRTNEIDSLRTLIVLNKMNFTFGYAFPSDKLRFIFTPYISAQRILYKYSTFEDKKLITLNKYLHSQYYHINFIQYTGVFGADIEVKLFTLRDAFISSPVYFTLGSGYLCKLSKKTKIEATDNTISSKGNINIMKLFLQAGIRIHMSSY